MRFRYGEIIGTDEQLKKFNSKFYVQGKDSLDDKLFYVVQKVSLFLGLQPGIIKFNIMLYNTKDAVQSIYKIRFGIEFNSHSFCDRQNSVIHLTASKAERRVVAHEIAHYLIHQVMPNCPINCHEILAQSIEGKI